MYVCIYVCMYVCIYIYTCGRRTNQWYLHYKVLLICQICKRVLCKGSIHQQHIALYATV